MNIYRRQGNDGYTIIELMIVLTVSTLIFISAVYAYSRHNTRTRFVESVNTFAQTIQDVLNDVDTGYYPTNNNFRCTAGPTGPPSINTGVNNEQGTNAGCIFLGKALELTPGGGENSFNIYTIVGRQFKANSTDPVSSIADTQLAIVPNTIDVKHFSSGVQVQSIKSAGASGNMIGIVANAAPGGLDLTKSGHNVRTELLLRNGGVDIDTSSGIDVCLQEEGGGRTALVKLGQNRSKIALEVLVDETCD